MNRLWHHALYVMRENLLTLAAFVLLLGFVVGAHLGTVAGAARSAAQQYRAGPAAAIMAVTGLVRIIWGEIF